ncbi:MAG: carboxypeptidase-like regulatory domain-containing protein [Bacteroidia bacterium]
MNNTFRFCLSAMVMLGFISCAKEPGEGGTSSIKGRVWGYDINTFGIVTDSAVVQDARVYISYGNNTTVDDDTRSSYTGEYIFRGLQKGTYTISTYSQCDDCPFNQEAVKQVVEITENGQEVLVPDLIIYD